jgi:hypothetical protein
MMGDFGRLRLKSHWVMGANHPMGDHPSPKSPIIHWMISPNGVATTTPTLQIVSPYITSKQKIQFEANL